MPNLPCFPAAPVFRRALAFLAALALWAGPAGAQESPPPSVVRIITPPSLRLPLECTIGTDCWIMTYPDFGGADGAAQDPLCGKRTYDDHKGTDFALRDGAAMRRGVSVLAAADGTVIRIRNGEPDRWADDAQLQAVRDARKECGNAVMIDHGNNLQTVYCHLRNDSIAVKQNQRVRAGDKIAEVGLSGDTSFPHLHFGVMRDGALADPFTGSPLSGQCAAQQRAPLWSRGLAPDYQPVTLYAAGFAATPPALADIDRDASAPDTLPASSGALVFWIAGFGFEKGDRVMMTITAPDGSIFADDVIIQDEKTARQLHYAGRGNIALPAGLYKGRAGVTRGDEIIWIESAVTLTDAAPRNDARGGVAPDHVAPDRLAPDDSISGNLPPNNRATGDLTQGRLAPDNLTPND